MNIGAPITGNANLSCKLRGKAINVSLN